MKNSIFCIVFLILSPSFSVFSQAPGNDNSANAIVLSDLNNWVSVNKAFTTTGATRDGIKSACQPIGPINNVWFKFQATTNEIDIKLKTGGDYGTITHTCLSMWDTNLAPVGCNKFIQTYAISLQLTNLVPGNWYYISVDNQSGGSGTFSLAINDHLGYDSWQKAFEISNTNDWTSTNAEFSTINASPDRTKPTCMSVGTYNNVWFKFRASTTDIDIRLKRGGVEGSMGSSYLTLFNASFTEVGCVRYTSGEDLVIQNANLVEGDLYYIMVDNSSEEAGTFTLSVTSKLNFDSKETAVEIVNTNNWCSSLGEYSNVNATADFKRSSCWYNGPNKNVWFKFQATTNEIDIRLKTGEEEGTIRFPYLGLWHEDGTEIGCDRYLPGASTPDLVIQKTNLTIGEWYYISVDNNSAAGTFSLCINDRINNDLREKAIVLNNANNWCSSLGEFSNVNASPDFKKGSCWYGGPNKNVWFKFQATSNEVDIRLKTGGDEGTITFPYVGLWHEDGTDIGCDKYLPGASTPDLVIQRTNLTIGQWYYISVDNNSTGGTFALCLKSASNLNFILGDYLSKSSGNWNESSSWKVFDGNWFVDATLGAIPGSSNRVFLEAGNTISLSENASCKDLHPNTTADVIRLNTGENTLDVYGKIRMYSGAAPGTNSTSAGVPNWITTGTNGRIRLKGTTNRTITEKDEFSDHENLKGWTLECDLAEGVIGTINSNFRAGNVIITSGNLEVKSENFKVSR